MPITLARRLSPARPLRLFLGVSSLMLLQACGGGGDSAPIVDTVAASPTAPQAPATQATPAMTNVQVYLTDDFSLEHEAVWLTLNRITAINGSSETTLITHDTGLVVNVPMLRRTGAWLGNASLPTDAHSIRLYIEPSAQLQALDGSMKSATVVTEGGYISIRLDDWDRRSNVLAIDFDLPRFLLQDGVLTVATRIANEADQDQWTRRYAEIEGQVTAMDERSLTVNSQQHGTVRVAMDSNTTFRARTSDWRPAIGGEIKLDAAKSESGNLQARSISERSWFEQEGLIELVGTVTRVRGQDMTINVTESGSTSALGSVDVNFQNAQFSRGSSGILQASQLVEAYVRPVGEGRWQAAHIEVKGARKTTESTSRSAGSGQIELSARLDDINVAAGTINLLGVNIGIDARTRLFDDVTDRALALPDFRRGDFIEVYATPDPVESSRWIATLVERERIQGPIEAEGRGENFSANGFTIGGVRIITNSATRFEDNDRWINANDFFVRGPGQRIEVEGRWDGTVLIADLVEIYPWTQASGGSSDRRQEYGHSQDADYAEIKGLVRARSGETITLEVIYAEYVSGIGNGSQIELNLQGAYFARGSIECLQSGTPVELKGYVNNQGEFRVVRAELEGPCGGNRSANGSASPSRVVEAEGAILSVSGDQLELSVFHLEYWDGPRPATLTVTFDNNTVFRYVTPDGLRAGMFIDIYGTPVGNTLRATKIELD